MTGPGADPAGEEAAVPAAADAPVAAFAAHDVAATFAASLAALDPDAPLVPHTHPARLGSRAEHERLRRRWEDEDGFRVLACTSSARRVQLLGQVAVPTLDVRTRARLCGEESTTGERETIVFARDGDRWVAVHEHLSPAAG